MIPEKLPENARNRLILKDMPEDGLNFQNLIPPDHTLAGLGQAIAPAFRTVPLWNALPLCPSDVLVPSLGKLP